MKKLNEEHDRILRTLTEYYSTQKTSRSEILTESESGIETMLSRELMSEEQQVARDMFDNIMQMKHNLNKEENKQALKELFA